MRFSRRRGSEERLSDSAPLCRWDNRDNLNEERI